MAFVGRDSLLCQITRTRKSYHSTNNINGVYHSERNEPPVVPTRVGGQAHHENVQISVRHSYHLNLFCTKQLSTLDESFLSAFWAGRPWTDRYLEWSLSALRPNDPNILSRDTVPKLCFWAARPVGGLMPRIFREPKIHISVNNKHSFLGR